MEIIVKDIIDEVRKLAANNPDFTYVRPENALSCLYLHRDENDKAQPGCIFGHVFVNLLGLEKAAASLPLLGGSIGSILWLLEIYASNTELSWMRNVQFAQDTGHSWSESVSIADTNYPLG